MGTETKSRVAVLGLGYVGCVSAACLARLGHDVTGVDRDEYKVRAVNGGQAPFYEPGLEEIVQDSVKAGRLRASTDLLAAVRDADIALVCVGTPSAKNGNLGLEQLDRVVGEIGIAVSQRVSRRKLIVAIRSTVYPGTCEQSVISVLGNSVAVVSNPEFLREGTAVKDFIEPSLIVIGGSDREAMQDVAGLYAGLGVSPCLVSLRTAEMIKYACNAFHAVKIGFANEIGALSATLGINPHEVMDTLCEDTSLNISRAYLKPGFAFGGSCLPKDLRALTWRARASDLHLPLLESVLPSNGEHLQRAIQAVLDLPQQRIGIFGLAFKENTDDLRESPVVTMLEQLIGKGRTLQVYDPHIQLDNIYGSNQRFLMEAIPHIGKLMAGSLEDLLGWAQVIVITQKPSSENAEALRRAGLPYIDVSALQAKLPASTTAARGFPGHL